MTKIGITMQTIEKRYGGIAQMTYKYKIISQAFGEAGEIWDMERDEKKRLKIFKYNPKIPFNGSKNKCFTDYKS